MVPNAQLPQRTQRPQRPQLKRLLRGFAFRVRLHGTFLVVLVPQ